MGAVSKGVHDSFLSLRVEKHHVVVREKSCLDEEQPERRQHGDEDREKHTDRAALHPPETQENKKTATSDGAGKMEREEARLNTWGRRNT